MTAFKASQAHLEPVSESIALPTPSQTTTKNVLPVFLLPKFAIREQSSQSACPGLSMFPAKETA